MRIISRPFCVLSFLFIPLLAEAQPVLSPSASLSGDDIDGSPSVLADAYGVAVKTWDDWVFVGAPRETALRDGVEFQDGAVYIYRRNPAGDLVFQQKLVGAGNSELSAGQFPTGDRFGGAIEAANGWLFIGVANDQNFPGLTDPRQGSGDPNDPAFQFAGQVHVYRLNKQSQRWRFSTSLRSPTPKTNGSFGARSQASHIVLDSRARFAVISELNNFDGALGVLHTFARTGGRWSLVQTIPAPDTTLTGFGDDFVLFEEPSFNGPRRRTDVFVMAGGNRFSEDGSTNQGFVYVFKALTRRGLFDPTPIQTIEGPIDDATACPLGTNTFGGAGMDAAGAAVAIADPCFSGPAGAFTGAVHVYDVTSEPAPLQRLTTIFGDEPNLFTGANFFGSRFAIAFNSIGKGLLIGSPLATTGSLDADGGDVRYFEFDVINRRWAQTATLTTSVESQFFRGFGQSVWFIDDLTAAVRHNNILTTFDGTAKSDLVLYDISPEAIEGEAAE